MKHRSGIYVGLICLCLLILVIWIVERCQKSTDSQKNIQPQAITTKTDVEMLLLPGGWFEMGSSRGNENEAPVHRVWVDSFLIDKYEVTQDQFRKMQISDPSHFKGPKRPVEQVTLAEAIEYCNERSFAEGLNLCYTAGEEGEAWAIDFQADGYRLPTEAEWEYACRAGSSTEHFFADNDERILKHYAWYKANSSKQTHPVGEKKPNAWGLYDMYGNVAEWTNDYYAPYESGTLKNPRGPVKAERVVLRGGAWDSMPDLCRSSWRAGEDPRFHDFCFTKDTIGFRCVRKAPQTMSNDQKAEDSR